MIGSIIGRMIFPGRHRGQRAPITKTRVIGDHVKFPKHIRPAKIRSL